MLIIMRPTKAETAVYGYSQSGSIFYGSRFKVFESLQIVPSSPNSRQGLAKISSQVIAGINTGDK